MRSITVIGLVLLLAGCGSQWSKPGTSPELAARDLAECRHMAQIADRRDSDIDTDILASRGQDWHRVDTLSIRRADYAESNRVRSGDLVERCMAAKGYSPKQ